MDLGLKGSVIVVTGGGMGIGQGISRICLAEGARVVVLSRNSEHVQKFLAETGRDGLPCELIVTELAETDQCRKAIEQIAIRYGRLDGLVNNAGCNDGIGLQYGIRVNAVLPAEVLTPLYESWVGKQSDPQATLKHISGQIPLENRMTTAAEIAAAVVFLLSPTQSGHTTAQHVIVDGGYVHLDRMLTAKR